MKTKQKSKAVAGLLGLVLGFFGVHNFYLGYVLKGLVQIAISVISIALPFLSFFIIIYFGAEVYLLIVAFILFVIGLIGVVIWTSVESIMILAGKISVDGKGNPIV